MQINNKDKRRGVTLKGQKSDESGCRQDKGGRDLQGEAEGSQTAHKQRTERKENKSKSDLKAISESNQREDCVCVKKRIDQPGQYMLVKVQIHCKEWKKERY